MQTKTDQIKTETSPRASTYDDSYANQSASSPETDKQVRADDDDNDDDEAIAGDDVDRRRTDSSNSDADDNGKPGDFVYRRGEIDCEVITRMGYRTNGPNNGIDYGDSDYNVAATYNGHFLDTNRKKLDRTTTRFPNLRMHATRTPTKPHNSHYIWFFHFIYTQNINMYLIIPIHHPHPLSPFIRS